MSALLGTRTTAIWLLLIVATLLAWAMGHGIGLGNPMHAGIAIIVVSMIKFRFILFEFMELRGAPAAMRLVGELWVLVLAAVLVGLFVSG